MFYADLKVDLKNKKFLKNKIKTYQRDLFYSENGNPSIVTNTVGNPGLDFWINYNGNVATWGNQYLDNLFNLYVDSTENIIAGTLEDPAALSFLQKGVSYRDKIVSEVNKIAVLRSKAVNIRDYTSALMFDEARTRLYYTIRVLQDYISDGLIKNEIILNSSQEVQQILRINKKDLIAAYNSTDNTIVQETLNLNFDEKNILDILEWINLGHYKLSKFDIKRLINYYNLNVSADKKIIDTPPTNNDIIMQLIRMTEYLTHIKKEALVN